MNGAYCRWNRRIYRQMAVLLHADAQGLNEAQQFIRLHQGAGVLASDVGRL